MIHGVVNDAYEAVITLSLEPSPDTHLHPSFLRRQEPRHTHPPPTPVTILVPATLPSPSAIPPTQGVPTRLWLWVPKHISEALPQSSC